MKNLILTFTAALFLFACGTEASTEATCDKDCKKENCEHGKKKCEHGDKECTKECGDKHDKKCGDDCEKECCANKMMSIGSINPSLESKLMDISGTEMFIEELGKKNGTLIIFSCNTCPFVVGNGEKSEGWENRYNDIAAMATEKEIGFALINSNEAKREGDDSFDEMVAHAKASGYNEIKYMMDSGHVVADAYNAKKTPHVYLFNANNELVYTGAIDDNVDRKEEVKEHWLSDAMTSLAAGTEIAKAETKAMGCSIKRVKKEDHAGHDHPKGEHKSH